MWNPFAFTPWPVNVVTTVVYAALFSSLLVVQNVVPSAPKDPSAVKGVNIAEAWSDLQRLTSSFHPYNSRANDDVRDWLLLRIGTILETNGVGFSTHVAGQVREGPSAPVTVFNDLVSNVTFSSIGSLDKSGDHRRPGQSVYFEGTNIIVYVRGSEDDQSAWWDQVDANGTVARPPGHGGILVNAHYDSVSTGFGATDDGVGVVTVLQLIKYYTTPGNTPKKGLVALLNNGEEDFLNGARAFAQHPISRFAHTFLNLEGAGAGGRATLFRSTDAQVTRSYANSEHPFGSVVSADGFRRGLIRSQTDYVIFNGILGLRGLDVAFMEPRARYHTDEDDARHTNIDSLWHMLSAALATTKSLTSDTSTTFEGEGKGDDGKVDSGKGSDGVWFDLYGKAFVMFRLNTMIAVSITLLIVVPLIVAVLVLILYQQQKMYFFSRGAHMLGLLEAETVALHGWRGFTRFPIALVVSSAAVVGLALLVTKVNPFIAYSSPLAVWGMMTTCFFSVAWFLIKSADSFRGSALYRGYALFWTFVVAWALLLWVTLLEERLKIAGGYPALFLFASVSVSLLVTLLECFALPRKSAYAIAKELEGTQGNGVATRRPTTVYGTTLITPLADENSDVDRAATEEETELEDPPTEESSLIRRDRRITFANYLDAPEEQGGLEAPAKPAPYEDEQEWSVTLPSWTWLVQFLVLATPNVILIGQVALLVTAALCQTGADGSSTLIIYLAIAGATIFLLLPLLPFLARVTTHLPLVLFLVFLGSLVYNLAAFPFSADSRYKVYFLQTVDLDSGLNRVQLTGIEQYVRQILEAVPSASGKPIGCAPDSLRSSRLVTCSWSGIPPRVVPHTPSGVPPEVGYGNWLHYNVTRKGESSAIFHVSGHNTRAAKILFERPITEFSVDGAGASPLYEAVPSEGGSKEIRLWRREWEKPWDVHVKWNVTEDSGAGMDGKVVGIWSDANEKGSVGALDELRQYAPAWVAVTKQADGLVEGVKAFMV
ncbi:MAG: hypothetical protein M1832_004650 [Thelocarpon impressellum]|nr:MAG: hypothetical protein M1832_004650 [Thelocarpon impressellum]